MVYLDHNATTPMLPEVLEAMTPWFGVPANPASIHQHGQRAAVAVELAREQVASLVGGNPAGVVFTSGATEANHLFLRGAWALRGGRDQIVVSPIEHPCVHDAIHRLEAQGALVHYMPVDARGVCSPVGLDERTAIVSLMAVNHETGVIQPLDEACRVAAACGAMLHVDATQAAGRIALSLGEVDGVVVSSHKLGGPGGVGALILRSGESFPALVGGGAQERGRRAGTVNTAGVVGFGRACAIARSQREARSKRWAMQMDRVRHALVGSGATLVGGPEAWVSNTACAVFPTLNGESLVQAFDMNGLSVSSGAACSSGSVEASPVLAAMGVANPRGAVRISIGWNTSDDDIAAFEQAVARIVPAIRALGEDWDD